MLVGAEHLGLLWQTICRSLASGLPLRVVQDTLPNAGSIPF